MSEGALTDGRQRLRPVRALRNPIVLAGLAAVVIVVAGQIVSPGFASYGQLVSLARVASFLGIMAIGQTIVILAGGDGIDLSVGKVATLGAIIGARLMQGDNSHVLIGIAVPLLVGGLIGLANGLGITLLRIPPFVMTLGMMGVVQGIALAYTGGVAAGRSAPALTGLVNQRWLLEIPGVVYMWIVLIVVVTWSLRRTTVGWDLYAVGTNRVAARLSGRPVRRVAIGAYTASGVFAALGGLMLLGYTESVFLNLADAYTLPTVAAVIIGGTLASGGVGTYAGTAIGAFVLTALSSLLSTMNMPESWRIIIQGLVLLSLLAVYGRQRRLRA